MRRCLNLLAFSLFIASAFSVTGCKASLPSAPSGPSAIAGMQLVYPSPSQVPQRIGTFFTISAVTNDANLTFTNVSRLATWSSSDPAVVQVTGFGSVRAVGNGLAQVSATYEGRTAFLLVSVSPPLSAPFLSFNTGSVPRSVGDSGIARANLNSGESTAANDVSAVATWTSSDPEVATVAQGIITGRRVGTVDITATYNGASGTFRFSVLPVGCC